MEVDLFDFSLEDDSLLPSLSSSSSALAFLPDPPESKPEVQQANTSYDTMENVLHGTACERDNNDLQPNAIVEAQLENPSYFDEKSLLPNKKKKKAHVNLRKSLAWNRAFFTEEGVLDQAELFLVNKALIKPIQPPCGFPKEIAKENLLESSHIQSNPLAAGAIRENSYPDIMENTSKLKENVYDCKDVPLKVEGGELMNSVNSIAKPMLKVTTPGTDSQIAISSSSWKRFATEEHQFAQRGYFNSGSQETKLTTQSEYGALTSIKLSSIPESPLEACDFDNVSVETDLSRRSSLSNDENVAVVTLPQIASNSKVRLENSSKQGGSSNTNAKPSGLKRPSPKLGFFDPAKVSTTTQVTTSVVGLKGARNPVPKCGQKVVGGGVRGSGLGFGATSLGGPVSTNVDKKKVDDVRSKIPLPPHLLRGKGKKSGSPPGQRPKNILVAKAKGSNNTTLAVLDNKGGRKIPLGGVPTNNFLNTLEQPQDTNLNKKVVEGGRIPFGGANHHLNALEHQQDTNLNKDYRLPLKHKLDHHHVERCNEEHENVCSEDLVLQAQSRHKVSHWK